MNYFEYKTRNPINGKISHGVITADDTETATQNLKQRGETVLEIDYMKDFMNIRKMSYAMSSRITKRIACEFYTMLSYMLNAGMSLSGALVNIRDSSINKRLKGLSAFIADEVRKGATLSQAMKKSQRFCIAVIEQINAGEESGNVPNCLKRLAQQTEREIEFSSKIKSAMMYPIIITIVMMVVLWVLMSVVVPPLTDTLASMGGELPLITKIVIGVSKFTSKSTPYFILLIIGSVIAYRILIKNSDFKYRMDTLMLKIPLVGKMLLKTEMSRFCRNLSAMQQSGITLVTSLQITGTSIRNSKIARAIEKASRLVEMLGVNLSAALAKTGEFPETMIQLIDVGVNSGQISDVLDMVANQYEKEVDTLLKRVTSLIEPIMIVVVGLLAGTVVISIFQPMFSLLDVL